MRTEQDVVHDIFAGGAITAQDHAEAQQRVEALVEKFFEGHWRPLSAPKAFTLNGRSGGAICCAGRGGEFKSGHFAPAGGAT